MITSNGSQRNAHAFPVDRVGGNPTIYPSLIVADLKPLPLNRFDQVKIFVAYYFAQHNISYFDVFSVNRFYSAELPGFNFCRTSNYREAETKLSRRFSASRCNATPIPSDSIRRLLNLHQVVFDPALEVLTELVDRRLHGHRRRVAESAETLAQNLVGQVVKQFDVARLALRNDASGRRPCRASACLRGTAYTIRTIRACKSG